MRYYNCYSAWKGRACCTEDIYVEPEWRGKGVGTALWARLTEVSTVDDMHHNPHPVCAVTTDVTCLQGLCAVSMSRLTRVRVVSHDVTPHQGTCCQCETPNQCTCRQKVTPHQGVCFQCVMPHEGMCCQHVTPRQGTCCQYVTRHQGMCCDPATPHQVRCSDLTKVCTHCLTKIMTDVMSRLPV